MSIITKITQPGNNLISTLGGQIQIDEGRGTMRIYDSTTATDLVVIDRTGFLFSDGTDRRIKLGSYAMRVGFWISPEGSDVIDLLEA
jgi:hypothetical protein